MAYQFLHVKTVSLKSGAGLAAEAGRVEGHCPHVTTPQEPILIAGVRPTLAWERMAAQAADTKTTYRKRDGSEGTRALRKDQAIGLAAVASYPISTEALGRATPAQKADFKQWVRDTMTFLEKEHGKALSAVVHRDEAYPHLHVWFAPEDMTDITTIHPGEKARKARQTELKQPRVRHNEAYREGMRGYQDRYFNQVGLAHGHARTGPKRRRMTRPEWQAEQRALVRVAEHRKTTEKALRAAQRASEGQAHADARASKLKAAYEASQAALSKAEHNLKVIADVLANGDRDDVDALTDELLARLHGGAAAVNPSQK